MALENRKLAIHVSQSANAKAAPMSLDEIPEWVKEDVETGYAQCRTNSLARLHAEFDSVEDAKLYMRMANAYAQNRPAGQIRVRKSPTRNQPDHVVDFRVTDLLTDNEKTTANVRAAVVAAGGSDGTPKAVAPIVAAAAKAVPTPVSTPVKASPASMPAKRGPGRPRKAS